MVDNVLLIPHLCISLISVFLQMTVCMIYWMEVDLKKNFAARLIFLLTLFDMIVWGENVIEITIKLAYDSDNLNLLIVNIFLNFVLLMNILITLIVSFSLYLQINREINPEKYEKFFYLISCLYSLIFSLTLILKSNYSATEYVKFNYWDYIAFYFHLWLIIFLNLILCVKVVISLKKKNKAFKGLKKQLFYRLMSFPIILAIAWLIPSIILIINYFFEVPYFLVVIQFNIPPLQGILNALSYGMINDDVQFKIKRFFGCNIELNNEKNTQLIQNDEI